MNYFRALHTAAWCRPEQNGSTLEDGATLADLAVAMLIGALVLAACYSTYVFASRAVGQWQARSATTTARYVLERRLAEDIRSAAHATSEHAGQEGVRLALLSPRLDTLALYEARGGALFRRGSRQHARGEAPPPPEAMRIGTGVIQQVTVSDDGLVHVELEVRALGRESPPKSRVVIASRLREAHLIPWHAEPEGAAVALPAAGRAAF